ncbi:UDP-N-acetylmuramoylalanine--D-glutamate ligase [Candidatus Wolfebacteria bacterium RBG_13_41_7]|uniref:UDP-N-acetylmuramoylalanine--D-glutamate ligase n=1 Tax=Candidatus Wolfebacteria bacterium RBG_13_41_7 TaxID=1802554 RepID=A0A1F8DPH8_9BACT|nr:MAG: UDP-N-acetylmuramoylalanine--D-glutamate ligase [Candidatus Wolfebacteria bacterium RBG_13_41_7]
MNIAILGFGREGKSVLKFLKKSPRFKEAKISVLDKKTDKNYLKKLSNFDLVFRSPGVPYNLPEIQKAIKNGAKFSSATALFFDEAKKRKNVKIIGITGTKGKGTTSTLLYKILKACGKPRSRASSLRGRNVLLAGNIGKSPLDLIPKLKKNSVIILELSSFQLQDLKKSPDIAVVLNIFPDHMDSHKNFLEYLNAKTNIVKFQSPNSKIFYDASNKYSKLIAQKSRGKKVSVRIHSGHSDKFVVSDRDLKMPGEHNVKNAAMAAAVALSLGCPKEKIAKVIKNFKGNEHRLELTRIIRVNPCKRSVSNPCKSVSIKFYNDSASTNPQTTIAAINAFKEPKILIAGGKDKGLNYSPLAKALKNSNTKLIILFGENKNKIAKAISNRKYTVESIKHKIKFVKDLKTAVIIAYKEAKILNTKYSIQNTIILFSPAAASFDMFKDYADRGKKFKELVKKLK